MEEEEQGSGEDKHEVQRLGAAADAANDAVDAPSITTNSIEAEYDKQGTALLSLIKNAEKRLDRINTD